MRCLQCGGDTLDPQITTCRENQEITLPDGSILPTIPYDPRVAFGVDKWRRCPDCNVEPGGMHHPGCIYEICPNCNGLAHSCLCLEIPDI